MRLAAGGVRRFRLDLALGPGLNGGVSMQGVFIRYWLPPLLWAALIFWGSTGLLSQQQTSRFIRPMLLWLAPGLSEESVARVQYGVRKGGHVVEYAVLAFLLYRALRGSAGGQLRAWSWRRAWWAFALAVGYAATDEWHQAMVATRFGSGWDVLLDAAGAASGLAAYWMLERRRSRR
jgi:VanZ family protein